MTPDPRRPEYEVLWRQARKAVQRGQVKLGYKPSTGPAAAAVSALLGRTVELGVGSTIRVADLDERVRAVFHCGLADVLAAVHGEPARFQPDQASVDAARREWTDSLLRSALAAAGLDDAPWASAWIDQVRRYAKIAPERLAVPANQAATILSHLNLTPSRPTRWHSRVALARAAGDEHALDPGRKTAALVLRAAALAHGLPLPRTRQEETHLWERCGLTDALAHPVLVHNFPGTPYPVHLPLRALPEATPARPLDPAEPAATSPGGLSTDGTAAGGSPTDRSTMAGSTAGGSAPGSTASGMSADGSSVSGSAAGGPTLAGSPADGLSGGELSPGGSTASGMSAGGVPVGGSATAWSAGGGLVGAGVLGVVGMPRGTVWVCMRARVVEAGVDVGVGVPMVCLGGRLSPAARVLLGRLVDSGCRVMAHGDFDAAGLVVMREVVALGGVPWRMGAEDYREALEFARERDIDLPALDGEPGAAPWDAGLEAAMRAGWAVPEEVVTELLVEDLLAQS
ncbi:DUF2399 domain-containing protein [Actinokineospora sp. NPDC004072]